MTKQPMFICTDYKLMLRRHHYCKLQDTTKNNLKNGKQQNNRNPE